jgi:hypothetical protein
VADYCALMDAVVQAQMDADREMSAKIRSL